MTPVNGIGPVQGPGTGYVAPVSPARPAGGGVPGNGGTPGTNFAEELQSAKASSSPSTPPNGCSAAA